MILALVVREIFIGAVWVLSTTITYCVAFHVYIKQYFVGLMLIFQCLKWKVRRKIFIPHHSICLRQFRLQKCCHIFITYPWPSIGMKLSNIAKLQLEFQSCKSSYSRPKTMSNNQNLGLWVIAIQLIPNRQYLILHRSKRLKKAQMHLAVLAVLIGHLQKTHILKIINIIHCTPERIYDCPSTGLITSEPNDMSSAVLYVGDISEEGCIRTQLARPGLDLFSRAVGHGCVPGILD